MDETDLRILQILQKNCSLTVAEVARNVGLSTTPCWRRIQRLEESGVIKGRVVLLDPPKVNLHVTVFVGIRTNQHSKEWLERFRTVVEDMPEVVEFYRMSGQVDYLLRVVVPSVADYDDFYQRLIARIDIADVSSTIALEHIKSTTELPLTFAGRR